jgi:hypothetical protein
MKRYVSQIELMGRDLENRRNTYQSHVQELQQRIDPRVRSRQHLMSALSETRSLRKRELSDQQLATLARHLSTEVMVARATIQPEERAIYHSLFTIAGRGGNSDRQYMLLSLSEEHYVIMKL